MLIYLNKYAGGGQAAGRWQEISNEVTTKFPCERLTIITESADLGREIVTQYYNDERLYVAAGGDGTVNMLLNEIWKLPMGMRNNVILGAIGLGSSNDFHKPSSMNSYMTGNIPFKLNYKKAIPHNIGRINYVDENQKEHTRYFMINCSLGIVAYANYIFNDHDRIAGLLKSCNAPAAIWYAGLKSLVIYKNARCVIKSAMGQFGTDMSNLGILIKPNFSGDFCYDIKVNPQSDHFGVALCENMQLGSRLRTIHALSKGKFSGLPGTKVWQDHCLKIESDTSIPLEFDGEVIMARNIKIELIKGGLKVCA